MSTNKTQNYNLHSWLPADDFLRTEINENFTKLDTALSGQSADLTAKIEALADAKAELILGIYTGDGATERTISLGFTPRSVLVVNSDGQMGYSSGSLAIRGGMALQRYSLHNGLMEIVEGGFRVKYVSSTTTLNDKNKIFYYWALK